VRLKWERGTVVVPGKLSLRTKQHWTARSIFQMQGQPSTPSAQGEHAPAAIFFFK